MFRGIYLYWKQEIRLRLDKFARSGQLFAAILIGLLIGIVGPVLPLGVVTYGDLGVGLIAYSAVSFGFSAASIALILAIPHGEFSRWLARSNINNRNSFIDLLFVFSWTAMLHWFLLVTILILVLLNGSAGSVFPVGNGTTARIAPSILAFLTSYSLFQFLVALLTLSQFGNVYVRFLQNSGN